MNTDIPLIPAAGWSALVRPLSSTSSAWFAVRRWPASTWHRVGRPTLQAVLILSASALINGSASANGLSDNRSWQFQTSADRANNAIVRDMIERKKGGFYDSYETIINNTTTTTIQGDQINCNVAPSAIGSQSGSEMDALTSSPHVAPGSDITADATGNAGHNDAGGDAALNSDQSNGGDQSSTVSDLDATAGPVDASGGATSQVLNNTQDNSGDQVASVTNSQGCSFDSGSSAPLN